MATASVAALGACAGGASQVDSEILEGHVTAGGAVSVVTPGSHHDVVETKSKT
jgi:hypothetical protein